MTAARNLCHRAVFNRGSTSEPVGVSWNGRTGVPSSRNERAGLVFRGLDFHGRLRSRLGMLGMVSFEYTAPKLACRHSSALGARPMPSPCRALCSSVDVVEGRPGPNNNQCPHEMCFQHPFVDAGTGHKKTRRGGRVVRCWFGRVHHFQTRSWLISKDML